MNWLPKIISVLIIIDALVGLLRPDLFKKYCLIFSQGATIYLIALIKALVGTAFLFGASEQCRYESVIIAAGILAAAGAIFIIAMPQKAKAIAGFFGEKNITTLRLFAFIYLLIGGALVYCS
jgi:uncharacterized protein YjeT (DUF2065 family)